MKKYLVGLVLCTFLICEKPGYSQPEPTYWKDIRPIFRKNCTVCHSAKHVKEHDVSGGLALDSYEATRKGTNRPILNPGKSADSRIMVLLETSNKNKRMPLDGPPLPAEQIALIRRWIDAGAKEGLKPDDSATPVIARKAARTRKLDVTLPTSATPPAGTLAKTTGKLELTLRVGPLAPVTAVAFSPDGKLLAAGCYGQAVVWDLARVQPVKVLTSVLGAVNDLRFSPDGKVLAVAGGQPSAKGDLRLYQVSDWKLLATLRGHDDVIFSIDFSRDGKRLASASFDKTVRIWDVTKLTPSPRPLSPSKGERGRGEGEERVLSGHSDFVYAVAFSPDARHIVSASKDRTVKMVESASGKSAFTFSGMNEDVLAVAFSPDGKRVVSSGFEAGLYWWNTQTGERLRVQGGHGVAVNELAFSKDGSLLVSAGSDRTIRVWNGSSGAPIKTISVGSLAYAVAISPDKKLLASGSFDGLMRLWDQSSGRQLATLMALPSDTEQHDWLALTPEGYVAGSTPLAKLVHWRLAGKDVPADKVWATLRQPDMLARAVRGEAVAAPKFGK